MGVTGLDLKLVHEIHDDFLTIIGNIKRKNSNTTILLSEIKPRNDTFDREVMQLNALLFKSICLDDKFI